MNDSLPQRVRAAAAEVARRASWVRIDPEAVDRLAAKIDPAAAPALPEETWSGTAEERMMGILAWNAVNFGSGWFPQVTKLPGLSGARTMATRWRQHCARHGVPSAGWLAGIEIPTVAAVFGQPLDPPVDELMAAFAAAWHELGQHLLDHHDGSATSIVEGAERSGAALAATLAALPLWDDRHRYDGLEVPLHKRAQITVSNLAAEFDRTGPGRFDDLEALTSFADNLVPHVLKMHGALIVDPVLDAHIERGDLLVSGEAAEVELRAVGVHAVELLVAGIRARGHLSVTAATVDHRLWRMGQDPRIKSRPRHRCRCTFY